MRELLTAILKTGSGSIGTLLLRVVTMKIMAVILGPSGVGLYALLRQTRDFSTELGGGVGGYMAMVQGLASHKDKQRDQYLITTFWIFASGALLTFVVLLAFAPWIAQWVLGRSDAQATNLVRWIALPVLINVATYYASGVLNGFRAIGRLALLHVFASIMTALLAYPVARLAEGGYPIAFIFLMSISQAVSVGFGFWVALREGWLAPLVDSVRIRFYPDSLRHFFSIAGTTWVTSLATIGAGLAVRAFVVHYSGLAAAGIFDVAWTLSMAYIMILLSSFGTYYLPALSGTNDPVERTLLMQRVIRFITLLMVPLVTGVIVLKPLVIELLYSDEFTPALEIIRWMLMGDYFKVGAWVLAMPVLAYANMRVFFWTEMLWNGGFLIFAALSLFVFGSMQGIGTGFLIMYVLSFAFYLYYARIRYQFRMTKAIGVTWLTGLALVVGASWYTWSDSTVDWIAAFLWIIAAAAFSLLALNRRERGEAFSMLLKRKDTRS